MKKPSTKTITATLSIAACTLLLCSCIMKKPDYGPTVKKTMTVPSFNSVELNGNTAVYFLQGKEYSVRLEGKKKLLDCMKIGVKNNVLNVNSTDEAGSNKIVSLAIPIRETIQSRCISPPRRSRKSARTAMPRWYSPTP